MLELDQRLEKVNVKYFLYMDDVLTLAPTRWKLREAPGVLNQRFNELRRERHPDKTFIGRIEKRFYSLGYHLGSEGLGMATKTIEQFLARVARLYEQVPGEALASCRFGLYVKRWTRWLSVISSRNASNI